MKDLYSQAGNLTKKKGDSWLLFSLILQEILLFYSKNFTEDNKFSLPKFANPIFIYKALLMIRKLFKIIRTYKNNPEKLKTFQSLLSKKL